MQKHFIVKEISPTKTIPFNSLDNLIKEDNFEIYFEIINNLNPSVCLGQFLKLPDPLCDHIFYFLQRHERQGNIRPRVETHHTTE